MEHWRDIKGFEGRYQVSSFGRIKSLARCWDSTFGGQTCIPECIMKTIDNLNGYRFVFLKKDNTRIKQYVHRIVAEAFLPNSDEKPIVNHKDCNRENNTLANLEWATGSENVLHGIAMAKVRASGMDFEEADNGFDPSDLPF